MHRAVRATVIGTAALFAVGTLASADAARGAARGCAALSVRALTRLPTRGVVSGDIDGDGRTDRVAMAVRRDQPVTCRFVLWVETRGRVTSTVVRQPYMDDTGHTPALVELARVNHGRAAQAIVDFGVGASVDAYGVYAVVAARLVRMRVQGREGEVADTFPSGGSNAGGLGSICAGGAGTGEVLVASIPGVVPTAAPRVGSFYIQRGTTYFLQSADHRLTSGERAEWAKRSGLRAPIFDDCAVAVVT